MIILPNMGLVKWDSINDNFSHLQLASNFQALDEHDHTPGKGKQIVAGGIAEGAVTSSNLAAGAFTANALANGTVTDTKLASPNNSVYRNLYHYGGNYGAGISGTRYFTFTGGATANQIVGESVPIFWLSAADFTVTNKTVKYRIRSTLTTNTSTAPAVTFTVGLYKVTSISGGNYSSSGVMAGSTVPFVTPGGNEIKQGNSGDFVLESSEGYYCFGVANSGTSAGGSVGIFNVTLQVRNT